MKVVIICILVSLFFSCGAEKPENRAVLTGKAPAGTKVFLQHNTGMVKTIATTVADSAGDYVLEWPVEGPRFYQVEIDNRAQGTVFVQPGWKIKVEENGKTIVFRGDGTEQNRYLEQIHEKKKQLGQQHPVNFMNPQSYKTASLAQLAALKEYIASATLTDTVFKKTLEADVAMQTYRSLSDYPMMYQVINNGNTALLPEDYYDFLTEADFSSPYLANLGYTSSCLQKLFEAMENVGYLKTGLNDYLLKRAERIQDSLVRENYLLYTLEIELFGYNQYLGDMMEDIEPLIVTSSGKEKYLELKNRYAAQQAANGSLNAGEPAQNFTGVDINGKKHALSDFIGKVVVVDVWNTGCKPCIAEIPALKRLEERFAGEEVVFISVALEDGVQKWKDFIKAHQMEAHQWIETEAFKSSFAKYYHIRYIPRFMVFGRDGKIVETYAPRPSNPRLGALISDALEK